MADPVIDPICAYRLDGKGGADELSIETVEFPEAKTRRGPQSGQAFVWVHLHREDPRTVPWLEAESGLDSFVQHALLAKDTRPRCTVHGEGAIVNLRGVNLHEGAEVEDMISVRLWVDGRRVIGVWLRPLFAVADLVSSIERGVAPVSPGDLIAKLALRLADRMEPTVAELHGRVDDLEEQIDAAETVANARSELADIRRQAIILRRFIGPQRDALTTLAIEDLDWLDERDRSRIREAGDRTTRVLEELESVRERAAVVHDQLLEKRAEQTNRYTLLLSVVAAIFLPLGLLTGLLGINVGGIPGSDNPWAFAIVTIGLVAIGAFEVWLFRQMKLL